MYNKIMDSILNKKEESLINIATVVTVNPLTIKFPPDTTAIPAVILTNLFGIAVNSRVLTLRYGKQFIVTGVIGNYAYPIGWITYVIKPSDTTKTNTTYADDPHLTLTLPKNGIYEIFLNIAVDAENTTPDIKCTWTTSNITEEVRRTPTGPGLGITSVYASEYSRYVCASLSSGAYFGLTDSGLAGIKEFFVVSTDSSNGTLTFRWAQNTSDASNVTVKANSYLRAIKIDNN